MPQTHGLSNHKLFSVWQNAIDRCHNPNSQAYSSYGGRGIEVCKEWRDAFVPFYTWAIKNGWQQGLSIDRIDNDLGYNPGNVRFVPLPEQQRNRRTNRLLTFNGETKCLIEWAEIYGIKKTTLKERLNRGWPTEEALTKPIMPATVTSEECMSHKGRPFKKTT